MVVWIGSASVPPLIGVTFVTEAAGSEAIGARLAGVLPVSGRGERGDCHTGKAGADHYEELAQLSPAEFLSGVRGWSR